MNTIKQIATAALLASAAAPALAQFATCDPTDPPLLAEGPISAVTADGFAGTVTSMGILITVPPSAPVHTPTADLDMPRFADPTPFPGRFDDPPANTQPTPGFVGATVTATGCVKRDPQGGTNHVYLADDVSSDVNENVLLGVVTEVPTVDAQTGAVTFGVLGTPISMLQDPRMPADPLANAFGLEVVPQTVPVGATAAVEGYYGEDGVLHVWTAEVGAGDLADPVNPQISIQRYRCAGDLRLQGGLYLGEAGGASCNFTRPEYSMRLYNVEAGQEINFAADELDVLQAAAPDQQFCTYALRTEPPVCPANVRIDMLRNGVVIATATTAPEPAAPNTPPVAADDGYATPADGLLVVAAPGVLANDSDADGDPLTAALVADAANGELVFGPDGGPGDGSFTYTPEAGFRGTDTFTYVAVDSRGAISNVATVTITVGNAAPVAANDSATLPYRSAAVNSQVTIDVLGNDTDANGDALVINGVTQPANGSVAIVGNQVVFTPDVGFLGITSFTYTARDSLGAVSNAATVTVTTTNAAPTAADDTGSAGAGTTVTINVLANDSDPEGDTLTVANLTQPAAGTGSVVSNGNGTAVVYTAPAGFSGTATFTYQARDPFGALSNVATVTVTVTAPAQIVDLDIQQFRVTANVRVNQPIAVSLAVRNNGTVNAPRLATIVGQQGGVEVYRETMMVNDPVGGGATTFNFQNFVPRLAVPVNWTATIDDDDPDIDVATATTNVR